MPQPDPSLCYINRDASSLYADLTRLSLIDVQTFDTLEALQGTVLSVL